MKTALTIAGSDSCGGAGIQADIKTMMAHGVYAMSAVTALTAQNTTGVAGMYEVSPAFLELQLDSVFTDIRPDAVKIGMIPSAPLIRSVARKLAQYHASRVVVDPVMVSSSGTRLMSEDAIVALSDALLPLTSLVTPNLPEAEVLSGLSVKDPEQMEKAAQQISESRGCAVLVKGGHLAHTADDLLYQPDGSRIWFPGDRIPSANTHGTGCTLSSAIAANLARGLPLVEAVRRAKEYLRGALAAGLDLGRGNGPLNHGYALSGRFFDSTG